MTDSRPPSDQVARSADRRAAALRWGAVAAGAVVAVLLVIAGLLSRDERSQAWVGSGALLAVLLLAGLLAAQLGRAASRPRLLYALVPASAGLATLTWLLGWTGFPGALAWWVPGAIVSALPLWAMGFVAPGPVRRPRSTGRR